MSPRETTGHSLAHQAIGTAIPVIGLFVLRIILGALPMLRNAGPIGDTGLTLMVLLKAAIDTVIFVFIGRLTLGAAHALHSSRPDLAEVATIVKLAGFAIIATIAYSSYEILFLQLAREQADAYNWIFLILVVAPLGGIVVLVSRRLDYFTNLLSGKMVAVPPAGAPPMVSNEAEEVRQRMEVVTAQVTAASGAPGAAASNMVNYLTGARQNFDRQDFAEARRHLDWAEYEAKRAQAAPGR